MNALKRRNQAKNWFRFALKLGLLATDATVLAAMHRLLHEREGGSAHLSNRVSDDLSSHRGWSRFTMLMTGVGIGVGLGMLFAPVSGEEARSTICETAADMRGKWSNMAAWAGGFASHRGQPRTGTYAD